MKCWNTRTLNRSLSALKMKQRYQYQLNDYLRECKNKTKTMDEVLNLK